ncbi:hypothetical protein MSG28_014366 [Choristoneura fumiferana]|uniref:Uncharacterized protein n=1 Tax=Choristoneura fumiferana TaxID=7141 RepID=A0ACC0JGU8_CHOFU|nr:hypothetical protein MSG28_014366 [Choristoneura fumiferana]
MSIYEIDYVNRAYGSSFGEGWSPRSGGKRAASGDSAKAAAAMSAAGEEPGAEPEGAQCGALDASTNTPPHTPQRRRRWRSA